MLLLALRDLQHRRGRAALTVALMAVVMTLLFIMSGLVEQFNAEPRLATDRSGGDLNWVVSRGTGGPFTSPTPVDAELLRDVPGVPILVAASALGEDRVLLVARDYSFLDEPSLTEGRYPLRDGEIVLDETAALAVGDTTTLGGFDSIVVGLTRDATVFAGVPLAFTTLEFGQRVAVGGQDLVLAKLTVRTSPVGGELKSLTPQQVADDTRIPLEGAISSVALVKALLWLITIIVIAAIIYVTALERTREFAVLKAVGARTPRLGASLLLQGLVLTIVAVVLAGVLQSFIAPSFPLTVRLPSNAWATIAGRAAIASLVAGVAGVLRVKSTPAAEAFA